jgi:serine/threonine-protein kinase
LTAEAPSQNAVGTLLNGTYRLERVIAEGGMGVVYEAAHVRLPRRFAVKLLGKPIDAGAASMALARFRREAEIASTLAHPHIVEVFDFQVAESGSPYLAMELLEGEDLADRLKRSGKLAVAGAVRIIDEIAQALDVAHTAGVVHRDLKPANIFLSHRAGRQDFVKVLDFGVSKLIDSATLTQEKAMVGTPLYMSPEQAVGTQELTPESDVFSLGAISFEMLTGRRAFAASSIPSILYQIVHGKTPTLAGRAPGLTAAVDEVFARVLAKKKQDRYARASQFAEDLRKALRRDTPSGAWLDVGATPVIDLRDPTPMPTTNGFLGVADQTEVDSSTRAEEALVIAERKDSSSGAIELRPRTPSVRLVVDNVPKAPMPDRPTTPNGGARRRKLRRNLAWVLVALGAGAVAALVAGASSGTLARLIAPSPPPRPSPSKRAPAPQPVVTPLRTSDEPELERLRSKRAEPAAAPAPAEPPAAAPAHEKAAARPSVKAEVKPVVTPLEVQFTFHVFPRGAEITVDDRKVVGQHLTLPYQLKPRHVAVHAAGYHPLAMTVPATANRTFELRLDRIVPAVRPHKPAASPKPAHDAAPVQDL